MQIFHPVIYTVGESFILAPFSQQISKFYLQKFFIPLIVVSQLQNQKCCDAVLSEIPLFINYYTLLSNIPLPGMNCYIKVLYITILWGISSNFWQLLPINWTSIITTEIFRKPNAVIIKSEKVWKPSLSKCCADGNDIIQIIT